MQNIVLVKLSVSSPAFMPGENIPTRFTCDGENLSPKLEINNLPPETVSLALIVEDPDAPNGTWTHWIVWDIPPTNTIEENSLPGVQGLNDFGTLVYGGPCPTIGTHRYFFRVYALDTKLDLKEGSTREEMMKALEYHVIGSGELMGNYSHI
jgi:Raf kinase inhibitor-like YbhB/YbcL family protein